MFRLEKQDGEARAGVLKGTHSSVRTPFFMPVATFATGRGIGPQDYAAAGVGATISNGFLLSLRPGTAIVTKAGGLGRFMGFDGVTFTDSGGFQSSRENLFLAATRNGIHLKSPFDGKRVVLTPKSLMAIQAAIGSDVAMVIDDMAPPDSTPERFSQALERTIRWAKECKSHQAKGQMLFAIVQGGYDKELRQKNAESLVEIGFDGYAIGGCAIGEPKPDMYRAIVATTPYLPSDKVRYLMGVGSPPDIVQAVGLGVDCFDSIFPTRNARHNTIFTMEGTYEMDRLVFADDLGPLEEGCDCYTCAHHTRAYIRHLGSVDEEEGARLRQVHNVRFMMRLMEALRTAIVKRKYEEFREGFMEKWFRGKVPEIYRELPA